MKIRFKKNMVAYGKNYYEGDIIDVAECDRDTIYCLATGCIERYQGCQTIGFEMTTRVVPRQPITIHKEPITIPEQFQKTAEEQQEEQKPLVIPEELKAVTKKKKMTKKKVV